MRLTHRLGTLAALIALILIPAHAAPKKLTVTGKLTRVMAIGGETSGWAIELNSTITLDGKELHSIEVQSLDALKLESLKNQWVRAKGTLASTTGFETGQRPILKLSSIKAIDEPKPKSQLPK